MAGAKTLVMGASGFLDSHVTRQLVERGDDVRELGWRPKPVYESVRAAAQFFRENRRRRH